MKVHLLHVTKDYHKLVEAVARCCYQSYHKVGEESHNMLRGIMAKGHLSVASVGNIVFGVTRETETDPHQIMDELMTYKEINNYIRWTRWDRIKNPDASYNYVVSFNILTLMDILKHSNEYYTICASSLRDTMLGKMVDKLMEVDDVRWFIDKDFKIAPSENVFCGVKPSLYNPIVLSEDYTALKDILNPYELDIHATVTVDIVTDRAIGLQMWRHADMTGGCELSQRYVDRSNAGFRVPVDLDQEDAGLHKSYMEKHIDNYIKYLDHYKQKGVRQGRAKEIARNILPNVETRIIQCRPLRQWEHFFDLRDSSHAQKEMAEDARALKAAFKNAGIEIQ